MTDARPSEQPTPSRAIGGTTTTVSPASAAGATSTGHAATTTPARQAPDPAGPTSGGNGRAMPVTQFLQTETASAAVLVAGVVAALVWGNVSPGSYHQFWGTPIRLDVGDLGLRMSLHELVNDGLMTLFFLVVGLEARREFDLGDLRDRRRFVLPMTAGLAGMVVPVAIYLAINHGGAGSHGWGVAMSTDTALALGALTLAGRRVPKQARIFLLTVFVVDDIVALLVIAIFYSEDVQIGYLIAALALLGGYMVLRALHLRRGLPYAVVGIAIWLMMFDSGVDPVVVGLVLGLLAPAYTPARDSLEGATGLVRAFREQPTAELARTAAQQLTATVSPNARLQHLFRVWASFLIVPLFALANAGVQLTAGSLQRAYTHPITIGILVGYIVGKPVAVVLTSVVVGRLTHGRQRAPLGWLSLVGSGTIAGVGFTVSLLVAALAFRGSQLEDAKIGALSAALLATLLTAAVYRSASLLPGKQRIRALLGDPQHLTDLGDPVDDDRDHVRGGTDARVTIVEYGDFECPFCGQAEPALRELFASYDSELRFVWRHLPLPDVHPNAQLAAEASEAAAAQGKFWQMHDLLLDSQEHLSFRELIGHAQRLGLDHDRFARELMSHDHAGRIARDTESADVSGVAGTPTFFINGRRHYGAYDIASLTAAVKAAKMGILVAQD